MKFPKIPHWFVLTGPYLAYGFGILLNAIVIAVNKHQMPVLVTDCTESLKYWAQHEDVIHTCLASTSRFKVISDWFYIPGLGTASPGDFFIWGGQRLVEYTDLLWALLMIHDYNIKEQHQWRIL
jgi:hypothetical protein